MGERTYTTSSTEQGRVLPLPSHSAELDARIKKVTVTDEGKLAIALECDITDEEALEQLRNLLLAQRGPVSASFSSIQGELEL
jgi:hypothetical protein